MINRKSFSPGLPLVLGILAGTSAVSVASAQTTQETRMSASTLLDFMVVGKAQTTPTELTARLSLSSEGASASVAQKDVNQRMAAAMKRAAAETGVEARAGGYSIDDITPEHGPRKWVARQELTVTGKDAVRVLALVGQLQSDNLMLEGLDWSIDDATREGLVQQARTEALKKARQQAEESAQTLGLRLVRLEEIRISEREPGPRPFMMMAARKVDAAPPQRSADTQTVEVTVSVKAELAP